MAPARRACRVNQADGTDGQSLQEVGRRTTVVIQWIFHLATRFMEDKIPLTVRLDSETQHALDEVTRRLGESRSAIVRQAIRLLRDRVIAEGQGKTPYELGEELFGQYHSGHGRLSEEGEARQRLLATLRDRRVDG